MSAKLKKIQQKYADNAPGASAAVDPYTAEAARRKKLREGAGNALADTTPYVSGGGASGSY